MYFRCPSAKIVSNASDDLPEPESPVITTSLSRGMSTDRFLRLCSFAPRTRMHRDGSGNPAARATTLAAAACGTDLLTTTISAAAAVCDDGTKCFLTGAGLVPQRRLQR